MTEKKRIYLSGKITGLPASEVKEKFARAANQIRAFGADPVNPLDNGIEHDQRWEMHMAKDVEILLGCDAIYLLKDWPNSKGARIERVIAIECNKKIYLQPDLEDLNADKYKIEDFRPFP